MLRDGPGFVCWQSAAQAYTIRGRNDLPTLHLIQSGRARYRVGRRVLDAASGDAILMPASVDVTVVWQPAEMFGLQVPADVLEEQLRERHPRGRGTAGIGLCRLRVDEASGATLTQALADYVQALATGNASLPAARVAMATWIADAAVVAAAVVTVQPLRAERARRLESWIDAHLAEPITLARLCRVAGVGARCLQKTFQVRHGTSPLEFVMQRRLEAARERLLRAPDGAQVIDIALDVGALHMGRFAQRYRRVFGEPPSATLRRSSETASRESR
jgi:AraC-like DNA-binding protein